MGDFGKILRVYGAVVNLVAMVKAASADKQITAAEAYTILVAGLSPILEIFGVRLPIENSPELQAMATAARAKDAAIANMFRF